MGEHINQQCLRSRLVLQKVVQWNIVQCIFILSNFAMRQRQDYFLATITDTMDWKKNTGGNSGREKSTANPNKDGRKTTQKSTERW